MARYKRLKDGTFQMIDDSEPTWDRKDDGTFTRRTSALTNQQKKVSTSQVTDTNLDKRTWFQKGQFEDGYQFGDVVKTMLGSGKDLTENASAGIYGMGEKAVDAGAYLVGGVAGLLGADKFQDKTKEFILKDLYDEKKIAKENNIFLQMMKTGPNSDKGAYIATKLLDKLLVGDKDTEEVSVLGEKTDSLAQSAGQLAGQVALQSVGVPWFVTSGATSFGEETESALNQGASYGEAGFSAAVSAGAELLTEKLFGGSALGEKGLINTDALTKGITNKALKSLADFGVDVMTEGSEEVASEFIATLGQQLSYEKEDTWKELLSNEEAMDDYIAQVGNAMFGKEAREGYAEAFVGGAVLGGASNAGKAGNSIKSGRDYRSGLTVNEQKVIDKEVENRITEKEKASEKVDKKTKAQIEADVQEDLKKGYIGLDTIESALGGKTYDSYKNLSKEMEEYQSLNKMKAMELTGEQSDRLAELKEKNKQASYESEQARLKEQLSKEVSDMTVNDRFLRESYNEKGRRSQAFEADVNKYDTKQQETIQKAVDSGILNNTRRTHEFVDMIAKISADKGVSFDFADNRRLKESGFAKEGVSVNGYIKDGNVTLNVNSAKALNKVVGHEITHVLEGSDLYAELQEAVKAYATNKGEYKSKLEALTKLYEGVEGANVEQELTADLIGEYLFSDEAFVQQLSTQNKNIFQKIYDEIKYLCKVVSSGSKEAKQLEKVKRIFEKAYQDSTKAEVKDNAQFSLVGKDKNGIEIYETSEETKKLSYAERKAKLLDSMKNEYAGRTAKFTKNGQVYYAMYDRTGVYKGIHGDKKSSPKGYKAKINIGADGNYIELAENALYQKTSAEQGKNSKFHSNAKTWDYYVKTIQSDGNYFDVLINVKDTGNEQYVYDITLNEADSLPDQLRPYTGSSPASNSSIPKTKENATENQKLSLGDDIAPAGKWNVKGSDIMLDDSIPIRKDIAPAQKEEVQQSTIREGSTVPDEWNIPISDDLSIGPFSPPEGWKADETENRKRASVKLEQTIKGRNAIKLERYQEQLEDVHTYRDKRISKNEELWRKREVEKRELEKSFDKKIAQKQKEYESRKNKDSKEANKLLTQIHNLEAKRNERITECEKDIQHYMNEIAYVRKESDRKITDLQEKIQKMNSAEFKTAEQRQTKQEIYRELISRLIGDTSTWRDKKMGISYQTNTLRRNLRDIVRDADGKRDIARADAIYDEIQGKYNHNEALLNREANKIKQVFADLKINKAENVYIQMLGEYRHNPDTTLTADVMQEYYEKHRNKINQEKVDKAIELARKTYDSLFFRVNNVLKEQGFKEIGYREGYFPHFTEDKQSPIAKLFNWKTKDDSIPTDIAGLTEMYNPDRSWQSFNKHRTGDDTDYSFMKGMDTYIQGALDWIYHMEDIQKRRALENEIRYRHSDQGIKDKIDAVHKNEEFDADEMQAEIDKILKEAKNPLNNFITDFRNATNNLAGKKDSSDRGLEYATNRKIYSTMTNLSNRVSANMVAGSISSALTNFIPITQSWGQVSPVSSLKAMGEVIKSAIKDDGMINKSDFMTNRLRTSENLYKTGWDIAGDKVGLLMECIDNFTTQTVWRSKYMENIQNGMSEDAAIKDADQFAENVIAGRSRGNMPTIFNSKNPITKVLTAFQLEVANQYGYMLKDMPRDIGTEATGKLIKGYATMFLGAYAYNALYSTLTGRDAALDPLGIIVDLLRDLGAFDDGDDEEEENGFLKALGNYDDEVEKEPLQILGNLAEGIVEETPFIGGLLGGGRIPISSALPYEDIRSTVTGTAQDLSEGNWKNLTEEWLKPIFYLALPMGGGQLNKTRKGLAMFDDDLPVAGSYTNSGKLRFSVDDDIPTRIQAAVFGQYASENAREYFDEGRSPLSEKKTQELADLDIPISDYWKIQDGLKEHKKLADKIDYVADLDLPVAKKNILANNLSKKQRDLTDYNLYEDLDELDFAMDHPEEYKVAKAVGGYKTYDAYKKALDNIKSNKDESGKEISGSRKTKVVNYLNGLSTDYGTKLILYKQQFSGDDTYNKEIVEYLNKRNDLSYSDVETILKELGFEVDSNGNVRW